MEKQTCSKNNIITTVLITLAVLLIIALPVSARGPAQDGGRGSGPRNACRPPAMPPLSVWENVELTEKLQLKDDQITALKKLDFSFREENLKMRGDLDVKQLQLDRALTETVKDESFVMTLAKSIADLQGKMYVSRIKVVLAFNKILTADQLKKLETMRPEKRRSRGEGRRRNSMPPRNEMRQDRPGPDDAW